MILPLINLPARTSFSARAGDSVLRLGHRVSLGVEAIDDKLHGGFERRDLHEFYAEATEDGSAVAAFAIMLAIRSCTIGKQVVWVREDRSMRSAGRLHANGLSDLGFDPDNLVLVNVPDTLSLLRAAADAVKCSQIGAVIIEPWGKAPVLDLTASRRLAMAAAASGVFTLMLRIDAQPVPSVARTRWRVAAAPSLPLTANAPGHPAFDIVLLRHRGGIAGFEARLEWNRDTGSFAPLSCSASAIPVVRTDQARKAA